MEAPNHQSSVKTTLQSDVLKRTRIALILEDDPVISSLVTRFLRLSGWTVIATSSIHEATCLADDSIEISFVDLNLPDGNGLDFIQHLKKVSPRARNIVFTGDSSDATARAAQAAGAFDLLIKPFQPRSVISTARKALGANRLGA